MNHSCSPNAEVEVIETDSGLDLLAIRASRDIPAGTAVTIHYDQRASAKDKRNRLTFWEWNPPTSSKPVGRLQRIQCRCARPCPNRLWRDELGSRTPSIRSALPRSSKNSGNGSTSASSSSSVFRAQNHSSPSQRPSFAPLPPTPRVAAAGQEKAGVAMRRLATAQQGQTAAMKESAPHSTGLFVREHGNIEQDGAEHLHGCVYPGDTQRILF